MAHARIQAGTVRVEDAHGEPPGIPFWLGEAPARSDELSAAVAELRREVEKRLGDREAAEKWLVQELSSRTDKSNGTDKGTGTASSASSDPTVLPASTALSDPTTSAAFQIIHYLADAHRILGVLPTQDTVIAERFFDQAGGMQLVIHAPFGSRINKAWGLSLRKRFCRSFNFELQAAATEDGIVLSLGPQHSFPLENVFDFLHPASVREVLVQALLDAPLFGTRWRWNGNISLAIPRYRGGKKVPPQIQRMEADDLLAAVFPDAAACLENIAGDREVPDHPLASQTITDCLTEAMDLDGLIKVLERLRAGEINCVARDLPEPSPLSAEILNARPYAFLDDAPLEERRTQAVYTRRAFEPSSADDLGALDPQAIERVREQAWPEAENADELHDALLTSGFILEKRRRTGRARRTGRTRRRRRAADWNELFDELVRAGRAQRVSIDAAPVGALGRDRTSTRASGRPPVRLVRLVRPDRPDIAKTRFANSPAAAWRLSDPPPQPSWRARWVWARRCRTSRSPRWNERESYSAGGLLREPRFSSGATGGCWRGFTAIPWIASGPRSNRSAPPTSCASCSGGSG